MVSMRNRGFVKEYKKQTKPKYWRMLYWTRRVNFWLRRAYFAVSRFLRGKLTGLRSLGSIIYLILASFIFAVFIVIACLTLEHFLPTVKISSFTGTLEILVQVSGIFIGLYFAAVSVVASTVYSRVPERVRKRLVADKVSNLYIWIVALLGAVSLLGLAANSLGHKPGIICLLAVSILGALSIFGFVKLGKGVFEFFNPAALAPSLIEDLNDWTNAATPSGIWHQDPTFQAHYRENAMEVLATYKDIVKLVSGPDAYDSTALKSLAIQIAQTLPTYCENKSTIPIKSNWFLPIVQHKDWLTADFIDVNFALATGTTVLPAWDLDTNWFEDKVYEVVSLAVESLLSHRDVASASVVIYELRNVLYDLGKELDIKTAISLSKKIYEVIIQIFSVGLPRDLESESGREELQSSLGLVETFAAIQISIALGFFKTLMSIEVDLIRNLVRRLDPKKPKTGLYVGIPPAVTKRIEQLIDGLQFEEQAEGSTVSPAWYLEQLIAASFLETIEEANAVLLGELERLFIEAIEGFISNKQEILAVPLLERGLEICNKYGRNSDEIQRRVTQLNEFRNERTMPWPEVGINESISKIESLQKRIIGFFAEMEQSLAKIPADEAWPDYFGHAYELIINSCYSAMAEGDIEQFRKLFPAAFEATLIANSRIQEKLEGQKERTIFVFSTEPFLNLFELTGYSIIYQEFYGKPFWDTARVAWDSFLEDRDAAQLGKTFLGIVNDRRLIFGISPRDLEREAWQQDFINRMKSAGYVQERFFYRGDFDEEKKMIKSPILRAVIQGEFMLIDAGDVFLAIYFVGKVDEASTLPNHVESFVKRLEREEGIEGDDSSNGS